MTVHDIDGVSTDPPHEARERSRVEPATTVQHDNLDAVLDGYGILLEPDARGAIDDN